MPGRSQSGNINTMLHAAYYEGAQGINQPSCRLTVTPAQNVVPEPISMALLGTGLAGAGALRRRRRAAAAPEV